MNLILRYVRRGWGISVCQIVGIVIKNAGDIWLIAFRTKNCYAVRGMHAVQGRYILAGEAEHQPGRIVESSLHIVYKSAFSQSLLGSLIADAETKCLEVQQQLEAAQAAYDEGQAVLASLNAQYDDIISWADMYDTASIEAKKMIVNCLIKRVDVYRDYKLHIDFNIDFEQFSMGLDIVWIAA